MVSMCKVYNQFAVILKSMSVINACTLAINCGKACAII